MNCQSIINKDKRLQIEQIYKSLQIKDADFISLNETFLKSKNKLEFKNYTLYRSDRIGKREGGAALGVKKSNAGDNIILTEFKEVVGFLTKLENEEQLTVFSIYLSPKSPINEKLFDYFYQNLKNFLILGDLNCKNTKWGCKNSNENEEKLEQILDKYNMIILNDFTPTYKRSQNVLDLSISSINSTKYFQKFEVFNDQISDHQATVTTLFNVKSQTKMSSKSLINWKKFNEFLDSNFIEPTEIKTIEELAHESENITNQINNALDKARINFTIENNNKLFTPIPEKIFELIKLKRKIRSIAKKTRLTEHKKLLNMVNRKILKTIKIFKNERLKHEFQ